MLENITEREQALMNENDALKSKIKWVVGYIDNSLVDIRLYGESAAIYSSALATTRSVLAA